MATKKKKTVSVLMIVLAVTLALYVISMIIPVFWTFMTTFKTVTEYEFWGIDDGVERIGNTLWLPHSLTLDNYVKAYKYFYIEVEPKTLGGSVMRYNIFAQFTNSILFSVGSALAMTLTSAVMGYATARFSYKFSEFIYGFVLVALALPIVGSLPSEISTAQGLGLYDTFPGIWIMRSTFLNTYFLVFHAQFKMIPKDYTEAAKIDGANPLRVMIMIIMPLAWGTILAVFVLNFIALWNDFQIPMVYLPSHPVAAYGMYRFQNTAILEIAHTPTRLAGICLLALPIIIIYAIFNKKLSVNLSVGGIKG